MDVVVNNLKLDESLAIITEPELTANEYDPGIKTTTGDTKSLFTVNTIRKITHKTIAYSLAHQNWWIIRRYFSILTSKFSKNMINCWHSTKES